VYGIDFGRRKAVDLKLSGVLPPYLVGWCMLRRIETHDESAWFPRLLSTYTNCFQVLRSNAACGTTTRATCRRATSSTCCQTRSAAPSPGGVLQLETRVDSAWSQRLVGTKYDKLPSSFAFNLNLRPCTVGVLKAGPSKYRPPRHPTHSNPRFMRRMASTGGSAKAWCSLTHASKGIH
jgi:hypothetical protein